MVVWKYNRDGYNSKAANTPVVRRNGKQENKGYWGPLFLKSTPRDGTRPATTLNGFGSFESGGLLMMAYDDLKAAIDSRKIKLCRAAGSAKGTEYTFCLKDENDQMLFTFTNSQKNKQRLNVVKVALNQNLIYLKVSCAQTPTLLYATVTFDVYLSLSPDISTTVNNFLSTIRATTKLTIHSKFSRYPCSPIQRGNPTDYSKLMDQLGGTSAHAQ